MLHSPTKIHLSIAAYRDSELSKTIDSALTNASCSDQLSFGICWQHLQENECSIASFSSHPQIRTLDIKATEAKGVCWARSVAQSLWHGEKFTLQLDSHHRFVKGWDEKLLAMWAKCQNPRALLTAYLPWYEGNKLSTDPPMSLGLVRFDDDGLIHVNGKTALDKRDKPAPGQFLSAHFLFGKSEFWEEVPYDPELYFFGEEISLAVRAYTHGWDLYYPNETIAYHLYGREGRRKHWDDHPDWWQHDKESKEKLKALLRGENLTYGLGTKRTLRDYEEFAGVSFAQRTFDKRAWTGCPYS